MKKRFLAFASVLFFVGGCQTLEQNLPILTPHLPAQPVHVILSPEVYPVRSALVACSAAMPEITLLLTEVPPGNNDLTDSDLFIQLGYSPDPEIFHAPLAEETFALVAHPDFPVTTLSIEELRAAYRGELQRWEGLGVAKPLPDSPPAFWTYPADHPLIKFVFQPILDIPENLPQNLYLAPDSEAMQQAIRENSGALGFMPSAWVEPEFTFNSD